MARLTWKNDYSSSYFHILVEWLPRVNGSLHFANLLVIYSNKSVTSSGLAQIVLHTIKVVVV